MPDPVADALRRLLKRSFDAARWQVDGLDDDAFFWEPVPGCWSVRPRPTTASGWGAGGWVCEDAWPPPDPVPVTTIAWRVTHLAAWTAIYRAWTFSDERPALADLDVPGTAAAAAVWLTQVQGEFAAEVARLGDADLERRCDAHWGGRVAVGYQVREIAVEHLHHGAEIGVLRDLRDGHARTQGPAPTE